MDRNEQTEKAREIALSPLAQDKTYGEKMYHRIFDVGINFWVNLLASAAFTFWAKHYDKPIWGEGTALGKLGIGNNAAKEGITNLGDLHGKWVEKMSNGKFLNSPSLGLDTKDLRTKRADSIANVFTLNMMGHLIVIPSVWLGAKVKPAIVKYFNRKHYGDEAMHSPDLVARHHAIEAEERPTFAGAVVGRIGSMAINMGASSLIGSENNLISQIGEKIGFTPAKKFKGVDPTAIRIGGHIGNVAEDIAPTGIKKADKWFSEHGYSPKDSKLLTNKEGGFAYTNQLSRFVAQDVMYTLFTSSTVHPVVNFARKWLPGMTYKPVVAHDPEFENLAKVRVPRNPLAVTANVAEPAVAGPVQADVALEEKLHHRPHHKISHAHHESTLHHAHEHAGAQTV